MWVLLARFPTHLRLRKSAVFKVGCSFRALSQSSDVDAQVPTFRIRHEWNLPLQSQLENRKVDVIELSHDGHMQKSSKDLSQFSSESAVPYRDLISLNRKAKVANASFVTRGPYWLASISHVRAVIGPNKLYLFQPNRPIVRDFGRSMSEYLPAYYDAFEQHLTQQRHIVDDVNSPRNNEALEPLSFQCVALEGILSSVSQKYNRRVSAYSLVVNSMLQELIDNVIQGEDFDKRSTINHLLALRNSLTKFERSNESVIECIQKVLDKDDLNDWQQFTTADVHDSPYTELPSGEDSLRLLLETYLRDFAEYSEMSFRIRQKIKATNDLVEHELDRQRNIIMTTSVELSKVGVSLSCATVVAGVFGMNLVSGFESHPSAFYLVSATSLVSCMVLYTTFHTWAKRSIEKPSSYNLGRLEQQQQRLDTVAQTQSNAQIAIRKAIPEPASEKSSVLKDGSLLDEIQDMVLSFLEDKKGDRISREEVAHLLHAASGRKFSDGEIDHIFLVFDHNHDGFLDARDMVNFMCSEYG